LLTGLQLTVIFVSLNFKKKNLETLCALDAYLHTAKLFVFSMKISFID